MTLSELVKHLKTATVGSDCLPWGSCIYWVGEYGLGSPEKVGNDVVFRGYKTFILGNTRTYLENFCFDTTWSTDPEVYREIDGVKYRLIGMVLDYQESAVKLSMDRIAS
jgi:hypothetical protein